MTLQPGRPDRVFVAEYPSCKKAPVVPRCATLYKRNQLQESTYSEQRRTTRGYGKRHGFRDEPAAKKALANEAIEARLASAAPARKPTSASVYSSFFARAQARKAATWAVGRL